MPNKEHDRYLKMLNDAVRDSLRHLPTPHCEFINEGEQTTLVYKHQMGDFELRYKPSEALDKVARAAGKHFAEMALQTKFVNLPIGEMEDAETRKEEWPLLMAVWFKMFFAHLLGNNAVIAVKSTMRETDLIMGAFMQATMIRPLVLLKGIKRIEASGVNEHLGRVLEEARKEKRDLLEDYLTALRPTNLEQLSEFYDALYPVWRDIQDIASRHKGAWREMVAAKYKGKTIAFDISYEDLFVDDLADDLFSRISGEVDSLTEAEEKIIEDHDGDDTPSSIAIEHAARVCGAWRYQFKARTLFRKLAEQRNSRNADPPTDTPQ